MGIKTGLLKYAALAFLAVVSDVAQATPTYCNANDTANADGISLSDMSFRGNNADDCYGVVLSNDNATEINSVLDNGSINWQDLSKPWVELVKIDVPATSNTGSFGGFNFTLSTTNFNPAQTSGGFTLSWSDPAPGTSPDFPITLDFVGVLKASDRYAAYLFTGEVLQATPNSGDGTWEIAYKNKGGNIPVISHISLYVRKGEGGVLPPEETIPEPTSLGLLGLGLLALGAVRRRKAT